MTIFKAYNNLKDKLEGFGIEDYVFEAKLIIKHITGFTNAEILKYYTNELTEFQQNNLTAIIKQRELRYPLQYILGDWDFYGNTFKVGPGVLVPRADTETLIDRALEFLKGTENPEILDICAGSGCIGITIAKEVEASNVSMLEKYDEACSYAKKNIEINNVLNAKLFKGDVFNGDLSENKYDLIVSNPPYISDDEMRIISPETKFEPETALKGGADGLIFYREIIKNYKKSLKSNGMIIFEVGYKQHKDVLEILLENGFTDCKADKDLNGINRIVYGLYK